MSFDVIMSFIKENYKWIVSLIFCFFGFLFSICFKKKPRAYTFMDYALEIIQFLPSYINLAEETHMSGSEKKAFAIQRAVDRLKRKVDITDAQEDEVRMLFCSVLESILSTPEKKGVNHG